VRVPILLFGIFGIFGPKHFGFWFLVRGPKNQKVNVRSSGRKLSKYALISSYWKTFNNKKRSFIVIFKRYFQNPAKNKRFLDVSVKCAAFGVNKYLPKLLFCRRPSFFGFWFLVFGFWSTLKIFWFLVFGLKIF